MNVDDISKFTIDVNRSASVYYLNNNISPMPIGQNS